MLNFIPMDNAYKEVKIIIIQVYIEFFLWMVCEK